MIYAKNWFQANAISGGITRIFEPSLVYGPDRINHVGAESNHHVRPRDAGHRRPGRGTKGLGQAVYLALGKAIPAWVSLPVFPLRWSR